MSNRLHIAMIQSKLIWEDAPSNIKAFEEKIDNVKKETDIIVLPEMFSTGFTMNISLAQEMSGESVQWMITIAEKYETHICGSLIIHEKGNVFNRFVFVYPDGKVESYDKKHLFSMAQEDQYFSAGEDQKIIIVNGFKINLMVCYDLRFPVWSRNAMKDGQHKYDALIYVANWPSVRSNVWRNLLQARAAENMAYVVGVNRVGKDKNGLNYDGSSMMIDPWGSTLIAGQLDTEEIIYGQMDMDVLQKTREKFPVANDADDFQLLR